MFKMIEHIEYLITQNDCVVVPGWGAIIAQYSSPSLSKDTALFTKPQRNLAFNAAITHDDGLLASSISRRENISYNQAISIISDNIACFNTLLNEGTEVPFGRLGFFRTNSHGATEFTPFKQEQAIDVFFGLNSFKLKSLEQIRLENNKQEDTQSPRPRLHKNIFTSNAWRVAASIVLLIAMTFMLSTPVAVDRNSQSFASLSLPEIKSQPKVNEITKTQPQASVQAETAAQGKYSLVIATFSSQAQVDAYLDMHGDLNGKAKVVKKGKHMRVVIAQSDDEASLYQMISSLPEAYSQSWVSRD